MKTVDFTKEIVCSDDTIKVVHVIPVKYESDFKHLIVYEFPDGTQNYCSVNSRGVPMSGSQAYYDQLTFLNPKPEPKVVSSTYQNVYHSGFIGKSWPTREDAEKNSDSCRGGGGILETLKFDDGASKVKFIEV